MDVSPSVYADLEVSRQDNEYIYDNYMHLIQWRKDGGDTILDIGSGPGNMTAKVLLPKIPSRFKYLVGVDIVQNMIEYAKKMYSTPQIYFEQWDMAGKYEDLLKKYPEGFDHIFSVYTIHWHPDQQQIIQNIYNLLTPGGDCLLSILGRHDIFDVYLEVSKIPRWSQLAQNKTHLTIPFQYKEDRVEICREYFRFAGFEKFSVEVLKRKRVYKSIVDIKNFINAFNPFLPKLSSDEREEYFRDFVEICLKLGLGRRTNNNEDYEFTITHDFMIVNAKK